jgi:hypothetical protein
VDHGGIQFDEEEHEGPREQHGVDAEEVARDQPFTWARQNGARVGPERLGEGSTP